MNIFKVANEQRAPEWFDAVHPESATTPMSEVDRINVSETADDMVLAQECDYIESCSANGKDYHYNSLWNEGAIRHLREYAIACGMDLAKFKGFDPSEMQRESQAKKMTKVAQTSGESQTAELQGLWKDPFNIDKHADMSHMEESNWEQVARQSNLGTPDTVMGGDVRSIGGGENYFMNSDINLAPNQNSITNPNAIQELAESSTMDNGERLRQEQEEKQNQKVQDHADWQQEKIESMKSNDLIMKGTVFPTETLNANTGLNSPSSQMGIYADFNPDSIPERTAGESLADQNVAHRESIQRGRVEDNWEKPSQQSVRSISDNFADALASNLNAIKKD